MPLFARAGDEGVVREGKGDFDGRFVCPGFSAGASADLILQSPIFSPSAPR